MSFLKTVGQMAVAIGVSKVVSDVYEGGKRKAKDWKARRDEMRGDQEPAGSITQQEPVSDSA